MNANLMTLSSVLAKIMEVANWILCVALIVGTVLFAINGAIPTVSDMHSGAMLNIYGFEANVVDDAGSIISASMYCELVCGVIVAALIAMVFRDIYLICHFTMGKSKHSKGAVPFQPDNVRMVREIGIFAIAVPIVQLIFNIILRCLVGFDAEVSGFAYMGIVFGVAMLCLSQVFAYGMQLQQDADGLI